MKIKTFDENTGSQNNYQKHKNFVDKKILKPKIASMKRPLKTLIDISSCSNSTNPGSECTTECSQAGFQNDAFR